ncbi:WRKY transcription factor 19 [Phytophthora cinnamomi]|uniref:WRKY transcription factor 19 n=1 Tax=Phytophthora cinnamomi TaxID=4785 RepID=UPI003559563F|nr:WRKY transcription factor 19 [Phytophthora cinnamomi]
MDDDGVEMEFVSVLGVLVPMEVTKGVSDKAKRLAAGGVSSEDEAQERAEDPFPDSNLDQDPTIPEHTETKCDASGCTNSAETQGSKHSETTSPKTADVHGHCVGHNDPVAPAGAQKSGVFGEKKAETEKSEKAACTPTTERSPVENGMKSVKEKQEVKVKKQKQKRGSKKRRGEEAKDDRRLSVEASGTSTKKHKRQCSEHNGRPRCSLPGCAKFAHSGGKCIAHGGGARCTEDGCKSRARSMGKCYAHGGGIVCSHPECTTRAKTKGKCVAHGGGTLCTETGCDKLVISDGKCIAHG